MYTLADVDYAGNETILKEVEVKVEVEAEGAVLADGYALDPVYPNPFNATLTIPFTLTESMNVSIELYSITGQKMMTVVNREFGAGSYDYTVTTDDLSSGIYLIRTAFDRPPLNNPFNVWFRGVCTRDLFLLSAQERRFRLTCMIYSCKFSFL